MLTCPKCRGPQARSALKEVRGHARAFVRLWVRVCARVMAVRECVRGDHGVAADEDVVVEHRHGARRHLRELAGRGPSSPEGEGGRWMRVTRSDGARRASQSEAVRGAAELAVRQQGWVRGRG